MIEQYSFDIVFFSLKAHRSIRKYPTSFPIPTNCSCNWEYIFYLFFSVSIKLDDIYNIHTLLKLKKKKIVRR